MANTQAVPDAPDERRGRSIAEAQRDQDEDRRQARAEEANRMGFPILPLQEPPANSIAEIDRVLENVARALEPTRNPRPLINRRFVPAGSSRLPTSSTRLRRTPTETTPGLGPAASTQMSTELEESREEADINESTSYHAYRAAYLRLDRLGAVGEERRRYQAELQGAIDRMQREERIMRGTEP
ncbi:MAG: hypothetical protein M1830_010459 [Pleopsidium flavum]|nr:MAG: hypothetical protein M1830_010459 [Pleopsidium flavum]